MARGGRDAASDQGTGFTFRSGGDAQLSRRPAETGARPPGAVVDDVDDPRCGLFQGETRGIDDRCPQPPLNGAHLVQLVEDLPQIRVAVASAETTQSLHAARPDLQQPFGVYRQPDDAPPVDPEQLLGRPDTRNQGNVDRLVAQVSIRL